MADHLSRLELDEVAAALPLAEERVQHLSTCAECEEKVAALKRANAAVLANPRAQLTLKKLTPQPTQRRWAPLVMAGGLALAAGLAVIFANPSAVSEVRLKGSATVELLDASGTPVKRAKPGDVLTLAVGSGGYAWVMVEARDGAGGWNVIWPSSELKPGARVPLRTFEATEGSSQLRATFSKPGAEPLTVEWSLEVAK